MRVAFDYDDTLDNPIVQEYAKSLVQLGLEVWIVTSRMDNKTARDYRWNRDIFQTAEKINIHPYNIHFCNMEKKYRFFQRNESFLWHLDNDKEELDTINDETLVVAIDFCDENWLNKCNELIKKNSTTLYRPVNKEELDLIKQSNYKAFPPRLPEQPIFYPVMNKEYAIQISKEWNVPAYGSGYVVKFSVDSNYLNQYEIKTVGNTNHKELWIPAGRLKEFNDNIIGEIEIIEEYNK